MGHSPLVRPPSFITVHPFLKSSPPSGPTWIHEIKFAGWRVQLNSDGERVVHHYLTRRYPVHTALPPCIIEAEVVANTSGG